METQKKRGRYPIIGKFVVVLIISAVFPFGVEGYPKGAPGKACADMKPLHGTAAQTSVSPYRIGLVKDKTELYNPTVKKGETVEVELRANDLFTGFLIKVEKVGDASGKAQGDWTTDEKYAQVLKGDCSNGNGVTHNNRNLKSLVIAKWTANTEPGDYHVFFTVVKEKETFWVKQRTPQRDTIKVIAGAGVAKTSMIFTGILSMALMAVSSPAVLLRSSV